MLLLFFFTGLAFSGFEVDFLAEEPDGTDSVDDDEEPAADDDDEEPADDDDDEEPADDDEKPADDDDEKPADDDETTSTGETKGDRLNGGMGK